MVAPLEQVTDTVMTTVEALRVRRVQSSHAAREIGLRSLYEEMVMIAHKAVRVKVPPQLLRFVGEESKESLAIDIVAKDRLALIASGGQVVQSACILQPKFSCHRSRLDSPLVWIKGAR